MMHVDHCLEFVLLALQNGVSFLSLFLIFIENVSSGNTCAMNLVYEEGNVLFSFFTD